MIYLKKILKNKHNVFIFLRIDLQHAAKNGE